ncbi:MAG: type II toxin-antitoxin system VapC family toxin [Betaproteobacteria bacterium]|nr:type II toxin-antitoxin system VapC family toxin [Betaproteobacteria bacterium]
MIYLLDTCVVSELVKPGPDETMVAWMARVPDEACHLSVITVGELAKGAARLPPSAKRVRLERWIGELISQYGVRIIPVDASVARRWGRLSGELSRKGITTLVGDGLIAATALVHGLKLATRNIADFKPFGVEIVDPWKG